LSSISVVICIDWTYPSAKSAESYTHIRTEIS